MLSDVDIIWSFFKSAHNKSNNGHNMTQKIASDIHKLSMCDSYSTKIMHFFLFFACVLLVAFVHSIYRLLFICIVFGLRSINNWFSENRDEFCIFGPFRLWLRHPCIWILPMVNGLNCHCGCQQRAIRPMTKSGPLLLNAIDPFVHVGSTSMLLNRFELLRLGIFGINHKIIIIIFGNIISQSIYAASHLFGDPLAFFLQPMRGSLWRVSCNWHSFFKDRPSFIE